MRNSFQRKLVREAPRGKWIEGLEPRAYFTVDLSATVSFASPASHQVKPGQSAGISITVFNNGDTAASGSLATVLSFSTDIDGSSPIPVSTVNKSIHLAAGAHVTFRVNTKVSLGFNPDTYFAVATVDPGNTFGESNLANNTAVSASTLTVLDSFPNLIGTWSGPAVVLKGTGKGETINQVITFTAESQTTGAFTFTGTNFFPDGLTGSFGGQGTISGKGNATDSGTDVPVDATGTFNGKDKVVGDKITGTYVNAIASGKFTLTRIG